MGSITLEIDDKYLLEFWTGIFAIYDLELNDCNFPETIKPFFEAIQESRALESEFATDRASKEIESIIDDFKKISWYSDSHRKIAESSITHPFWEKLSDVLSFHKLINEDPTPISAIKYQLNKRDQLHTLANSLSDSTQEIEKMKENADFGIELSIRACMSYHRLKEKSSKLDNQLYISTLINYFKNYTIQEFDQLESAALQYLIGRIGRFLKFKNLSDIDFQGPFDPKINPKEDYKWLRVRARYYLDRSKQPETTSIIISHLKYVMPYVIYSEDFP
ncbi:MAG: hypothetical protein ABJ004_06285 [Cyclobacteriaceae bacterium]